MENLAVENFLAIEVPVDVELQHHVGDSNCDMVPPLGQDNRVGIKIFIPVPIGRYSDMKPVQIRPKQNLRGEFLGAVTFVEDVSPGLRLGGLLDQENPKA